MIRCLVRSALALFCLPIAVLQLSTESMAATEKTPSLGEAILLEGQVLDAANQQALAARLYIQDAEGGWHFPMTNSGAGSAVRYERRNWINTNIVEMHTTLSPHPFRVELRPGRYTFTVERGKEYFPHRREVTVGHALPRLTLSLSRWIHMAELGWYSGDTHVHRHPADLPNVMLAEDVNVGLPMVDWTTVSTVAPRESKRGLEGSFGNSPVAIDATHVWHPRNTEYEIFRTGNKDHTLGALLILNHRTRLDQPVFPLQALAERARREGALLDLEKHNWPWSLALVPLLNVDLFELANNHHWRTDYGITNWAVPAPSWMGLSGSGTDNEHDWTLYGFQTYYALLNCGFRLRPAAGSASGVHPVPLGFSRVYVHLDTTFTFDGWMRGLAAGRSFVTTGPMLLARVDGQWPGATLPGAEPPKAHQLECTIFSEQPLESIELIINGGVARRFAPANTRTSAGSFQSRLATDFQPAESSWLAWRCFEKRPNGRQRFAHTGPWHIEVPGRPLRPVRRECDWLIARVKEEIARSKGIAPEALLNDYQRALAKYEAIAQTAR